MKNLVVIILALFLGFAWADTQTKSEKIVKFKVDGMMCAACPTAIQDALNKVEGVKNAKADLETKKVEITCKENTNEKELENAIEHAGDKIGHKYEATLVTEKMSETQTQHKY